MHITIRRVPLLWEHPRDKQGRYIPRYDQTYEWALEKWREAKDMWEAGFKLKNSSLADITRNTIEEWIEMPKDYQGCLYQDTYPEPYPDNHVPAWTAQFTTAYQLYDDIRRIPLSPVHASAAALAVSIERSYQSDDIEDMFTIGYLNPSDYGLEYCIQQLWGIGSCCSTNDIVIEKVRNN